MASSFFQLEADLANCNEKDKERDGRIHQLEADLANCNAKIMEITAKLKEHVDRTRPVLQSVKRTKDVFQGASDRLTAQREEKRHAEVIDRFLT